MTLESYSCVQHTAFPELPVVRVVLRPAVAFLRTCRDSCPMDGYSCKHLAVLQDLKNSRITAGTVHPVGIVCNSSELHNMGA